jgi:hypothetical protein
VRGGPFVGLRYVEEAATVGKLVGLYERELHGVVEELARSPFDVIVNVGSAEGYYAVGLARLQPDVIVYAFDTAEEARRLCARMAELNGVSSRVLVEERCSPERLNVFSPATHVLLLLDCEGCELELLRPDLVPSLRRWPILVELHEFLQPDAARTVLARFQDTHRVELIEQARRDPPDFPEQLAELGPRQRRLALDEHRPTRMRWAYLRPRSATLCEPSAGAGVSAQALHPHEEKVADHEREASLQ